MQVTNIEIKQASNGNSYKQVNLAQKMFGDKDRVNVFQDHPLYAQLEAGFDIPDTDLYINQKGYLELKNDTPKKNSNAGVSEMAIKTHIDR